MQVVKEFIANVADLRTTRLAICEPCENNQHMMCKECGCFLEFKVLLENSACPIDKW
jgi:Fe2+ or Zn2+ uptake regulation protein